MIERRLEIVHKPHNLFDASRPIKLTITDERITVKFKDTGDPDADAFNERFYSILGRIIATSIPFGTPSLRGYFEYGSDRTTLYSGCKKSKRPLYTYRPDEGLVKQRI